MYRLIPDPVGMTLEDRIVVLERMLFELKTQLQVKTHGDNLMMARIREELDMILNCKKEDRIVSDHWLDQLNHYAYGQ